MTQCKRDKRAPCGISRLGHRIAHKLGIHSTGECHGYWLHEAVKRGVGDTTYATDNEEKRSGENMATKGLDKYKYFIEVGGEYAELGTLENVTVESEEVKRPHYIADEALGGIEREYVEVDREADVGDYVMSKWSEKIYTVTEVSDAHALITTPEQLGHPNGFYYGSYKTLSPTNIIRLSDGKRYEMVDREAKVGEKVMYIINGKSDGIVTTVTDVGVQYVDVEEYVNDEGTLVCAIDHIAYFVLVPVKEEAEATAVEAPKDAQALIANLAKEVAQLKRESATQEVDSNYAIQKVSEEVNDLAERIQRNFNELSEKVDSNAKDIRTWAEDYEETKAKVKTIDSYQDETIDRVNGLADLTEKLTDDIVTLDERTQAENEDDKQPIGIKPRIIHEGERIKELLEAIERYKDAGKSIPKDWVKELYDLFYCREEVE